MKSAVHHGCLVIAVLFFGPTLRAAEAQAHPAKQRGESAAANAPATAGFAPAPDYENIPYGPAERNVLDLWLGKSADGSPTPLVIHIHGGGFIMGNKSHVRRSPFVGAALNAGVSVASINYRFLSDEVPIQDILRDCARAVQFLRANASKWNLDKQRVAAFGSSAGAGTSVWLATHDDLADLQSADPVARESTRLTCAGSMWGQFSYDFPRWGEVFGEDLRQKFGGRYNSPGFYGFKTLEELNSAEGKKVRSDCDLEALISPDDPPLFISVSLPDLELANVNQFLHHPRHSQLLYERCREQGVPVVADIPALKIEPPHDGPKNWTEFVLARLKP